MPTKGSRSGWDVSGSTSSAKLSYTDGAGNQGSIKVSKNSVVLGARFMLGGS